MSECFEQINVESKAVYRFQKGSQLTEETFIECNRIYHKDIDDLPDLTKFLETLTSTAKNIVSATNQDLLWLKKTDQKRSMPLVKALPQVRSLLKAPQFWNKYDSEQIAEITRENARQIAENDAVIGEKLLYNCDKEIKHMLFIYESLQESIWNLDLQYLNAYKATVILRKRRKYQKRHGRKADAALKRIKQKRLDMQKVGILQTMADAPFEIAEYLRANPTVTDVDLM